MILTCSAQQHLAHSQCWATITSIQFQIISMSPAGYHSCLTTSPCLRPCVQPTLGFSEDSHPFPSFFSFNVPGLSASVSLCFSPSTALSCHFPSPSSSSAHSALPASGPEALYTSSSAGLPCCCFCEAAPHKHIGILQMNGFILGNSDRLLLSICGSICSFQNQHFHPRKGEQT